jgi:2-dehydro-3-deoxy-D-arabinonate dehydratase
MAMALWQVAIEGEKRLARGQVDIGPQELLAEEVTLETLLGGNQKTFISGLLSKSAGTVPQGIQLLPPVHEQEIWAAGVTYERSREARREESKLPDQYERVYDAERPEIFFKSAGNKVRGTQQPIGIRADSTWDVPEPELGLVANSHGEIVAYTIGNDVSSRSIEGENALYLPQAKYYTGSCAIGPCLVPKAEALMVRDMIISLRITRNGNAVFDDSVSVARMKRSAEELMDWLFRAQDFPTGVFLLTGTGLVPAGDFTLQPADEVSIAITGLGVLCNRVERVGRS